MKRNLFSALAVLAALAAAPLYAQDGVVYDGTSYEGTTYAGSGYTGSPVGYDDSSNWHSGYYHVMWGKPLALVVPPTLTHQTNWGWGVGNTRVSPIYPQFNGPMMNTSAGQAFRYRPTPFYPSDTLQFGVYYIRGPW